MMLHRLAISETKKLTRGESNALRKRRGKNNRFTNMEVTSTLRVVVEREAEYALYSDRNTEEFSVQIQEDAG